ncbi:MAG TPA: peptidylprolyl isomerase [Gaiellaceae bacterium]|jgi:parvulin-like peptidyl-prolyl isomerase|nr:peptidylprolyl isomerase [Gaiellaceae bacterium]
MPFWTRIVALLAALALAMAAVGCGGDGGDDGTEVEVPADAIAVVGDKEITKAEYDRLLASAEKTYEAREQEFPAAGTPEFAQLRNAIVRSLVEQAQFEIAAQELDVTVTDADVDKRLDELKEQFFQGDEQKYKDELEAQGLTEEQVKSDLRTRLLSEKVFEKVTNEVEVTDEDVQKYYEDNAAQFETPASREVRHILVKSKARADQLHAQLEGGADFAKLARQYSTDPASKKEGGKFTAQQGATVAPFDKVAFDLDTGELSEPVKTQFGWHIIEAVGDIKEKSTQDLSAVEEQIRSTLLEEKKNTRINEWIEELRARFEDQTAYAPGFEPPPPAETTTGEGDTGGETGTTTTE